MEKKQVTKRSEDSIQAECYLWFNNMFCTERQGDSRYIIFSVPNGGTRNGLEAKRLKNTGVLSGVSDLIIVTPYKTIFVEMKAEKGVLSGNQMLFRDRAKRLHHDYHVCYSVDEFKKMAYRIVRREKLITKVMTNLKRGNTMFRLIIRMLKKC